MSQKTIRTLLEVIGAIIVALIGYKTGVNNTVIYVDYDGERIPITDDDVVELKDEVGDLNEKNSELNKRVLKLESEISNNSNHISNIETDNEGMIIDKVDIFTMQSFIGNLDAYTFSTSGEIDSEGNKYPDGYNIQFRSKKNSDSVTYIVDNRYNTISGTIALNDNSKDAEFDVWVEFYSEGYLIGKTEHLHKGIRAQYFEVDISGVEELEIVFKNEHDNGLYHVFVLTEGFFLE